MGTERNGEMTDESKKVLYGAARTQRIRKIENDVLADCGQLMHEKGHIPVVVLTDDGEQVLTSFDVKDVIIAKLTEAVFQINRLKAGTPA